VNSSRSAIEELALELAWSLWGELGVRGVIGGRHEQWSIDPEPLIAFTAREGDRDPRLRDESIDWCLMHERYVSRARLRSIVRRADPSTRRAFGAYAATLSEHTGRAWPEATEPLPYQPTRRSRLAPLTKPGLIRLRLRAVFGVGARAEILHSFVAHPRAPVTAAELARVTAYTKRNVTEELDRLAVAGLLQVAAPSNQFLYRLNDPTALLDFVGERPRVFPNWEPLFRIAAGLLDTTRATESAPETIQAIELEKLAAEIAPDLQAAGVPLPRDDRERAGSPEALLGWAFGFMRKLATGEGWPDLELRRA
jgi:DNA-binding transcriptional ArsR family regulator